jgi:hypothetical protein
VRSNFEAAVKVPEQQVVGVRGATITKEIMILSCHSCIRDVITRAAAFVAVLLIVIFAICITLLTLLLAALLATFIFAILAIFITVLFFLVAKVVAFTAFGFSKVSVIICACAWSRNSGEPGETGSLRVKVVRRLGGEPYANLDGAIRVPVTSVD